MAGESDVNVGWIGTGVMGGSMCGHVLDAGYSVTVHTRTQARAQVLIDRGAVWAESPAAVAQASDIVCTIVGFPKDVREVLLGADGAIAHAREATTIVDLTTTEPSLAVEIYETASARGVTAIDAPVSGGDIGARNGALSIMVGGDADAIERATPIMNCFGKTIVHQGGAGRRPAHQDGQPDPDRNRHDRRLRGPSLRLSGWSRARDGARVSWRRRRR